MAGRGAEAERSYSKAGTTVKVAALATGVASVLAEELTKELAIAIPFVRRDLHVANDQKLHGDHRHERLLTVGLAFNRSIADCILGIVYEIPVLHVEQVTDEPWAVDVTQPIF